jgi:signal transduction histidine kinase
MANRAAAIGGTVSLIGSALGGLAVCVELPCPAARGGDA